MNLHVSATVLHLAGVSWQAAGANLRTVGITLHVVATDLRSGGINLRVVVIDLHVTGSDCRLRELLATGRNVRRGCPFQAGS